MCLGRFKVALALLFFLFVESFRSNGENTALSATDVKLHSSDAPQAPVVETPAEAYEKIPLSDELQTELGKNFKNAQEGLAQSEEMAASDVTNLCRFCKAEPTTLVPSTTKSRKLPDCRTCYDELDTLYKLLDALFVFALFWPAYVYREN